MDKRKGFLIEDILVGNNSRNEPETNEDTCVKQTDESLKSNYKGHSLTVTVHKDEHFIKNKSTCSDNSLEFKDNIDSGEINFTDSQNKERSESELSCLENSEVAIDISSKGNIPKDDCAISSFAHFPTTPLLHHPVATSQQIPLLCSPHITQQHSFPEQHLAQLLQFNQTEQQHHLAELLHKHSRNSALHLARFTHQHHYPHAPKTRKRDKKMRRPRTNFSDQQLRELEGLFVKQKYLNVQERTELAEKLGLNEMQIKTWYQNRRTKWKRQTQLGLDMLSHRNIYQNTEELYPSPTSQTQQLSVPTAFSIIKPNPISLTDVLGASQPSVGHYPLLGYGLQMHSAMLYGGRTVTY